MIRLNNRFFESEREDLRDLLTYLWCRVVGHRPLFDGGVHFCTRCGDVLPEGNKKRQR